LLLILSIVFLSIGLAGISRNGDKKDLNAYYGFAMLFSKMTAGFGGIVLLTCILGLLTAKCRNSGVNCLFACPFIVVSLALFILLLIIANVANGGGN
jgi:hypothetical protein